MISSRMQTFSLVAVIVFFAALILMLKKGKLSLRYSLLWMFSGLLMLILALFPGTLDCQVDRGLFIGERSVRGAPVLRADPDDLLYGHRIEGEAGNRPACTEDGDPGKPDRRTGKESEREVTGL